jgi:hypothetical protein
MRAVRTELGAARPAAHGAEGRRDALRLAASAVRALLVVSLIRATAASAGSLAPSVPSFNPHFPVFGGGKFVNIFESDAALTNASAHVAWSLAVPLLGEHLGGRKGLWVSGLSWIALSLTQEALFHAPPNPGAGYASEVRADLLTRIVPCATLLAWDLLRGGRPLGRRHVMPPDRLRELGVDWLPPDRADHLLREAALRMPALGPGGRPAAVPDPGGSGSVAAGKRVASSLADASGPPASPTAEGLAVPEPAPGTATGDR